MSDTTPVMSIDQIKNMLATLEMKPLKTLGQNFLISERFKKINYENIPRFIIPLFLAGTMTVALMSLFDLSRAISVILSLFAVVQLQKFEII